MLTISTMGVDVPWWGRRRDTERKAQSKRTPGTKKELMYNDTLKSKFEARNPKQYQIQRT
jgi:hypothetical protein